MGGGKFKFGFQCLNVEHPNSPDNTYIFTLRLQALIRIFASVWKSTNMILKISKVTLGGLQGHLCFLSYPLSPLIAHIKYRFLVIEASRWKNIIQNKLNAKNALFVYGMRSYQLSHFSQDGSDFCLFVPLSCFTSHLSCFHVDRVL